LGVPNITLGGTSIVVATLKIDAFLTQNMNKVKPTTHATSKEVHE
jgi:hypothetical protein